MTSTLLLHDFVWIIVSVVDCISRIYEIVLVLVLILFDFFSVPSFVQIELDSIIAIPKGNNVIETLDLASNENVKEQKWKSKN